MNILEEIVANKRIEIDNLKSTVKREFWEQTAEFGHRCVSLKASLAASDTGIIAEFKRRSPSKGDINPAATVASVVPGYAKAGASAVSVLQDEKFFGGGRKYMVEARQLTDIPLLYNCRHPVARRVPPIGRQGTSVGARDAFGTALVRRDRPHLRQHRHCGHQQPQPEDLQC